MICQLPIIFFFCPFSILWYKFLSYIEVLHVLSELSELSKLSELIERPEVFRSMKKCLLHSALRPGGPLLEPLELRFVSLSSETSRSFGTTQTSQSSVGSHPVFPDVVRGGMEEGRWGQTCVEGQTGSRWGWIISKPQRLLELIEIISIYC